MKTFLRLGRWCHPTSDHYKNKCDQLYKMALANSDSCSVSHYNNIEKLPVKLYNVMGQETHFQYNSFQIYKYGNAIMRKKIVIR